MSLDERYGRRPPRPARRRWLFAGVAVFVLVAGAWLVWAGISVAGSSLTWQDAGADASGPAAVRVSFVVSMTPGGQAICTVRATDTAGTAVGWMDVPVVAPASGRVRQTVLVPTSQPATGGGVGACARR
ncbi:MAG TPA: DUF4307 domain-containing protein [Kineosporiaceae bacterium]|nr:DUF4307 domain-containing protein [Kineosporiaceae bacterium]